MGAVTVWTFLVPDLSGFEQPGLARIFLWHFPAAMLATGWVLVAPYLSWRYLQGRDPKWDVRAAAAGEMALLFGVLTMVTGMLFSRVQWNAWWQQDPRQTSYALVLLFLGAYFALRAAFSDPARRAAVAAAYSLASALPVLFLTFVFPRLKSVEQTSFHPVRTVQEGLMGPDYRNAMIGVLVMLAVFTYGLYRARVRASQLETALEDLDGKLEIRGGDPAPVGVVRPVPLQPED